MSDTIIYEHDSIHPNSNNRLPLRYHLIKSKNQVLHIYTESVLPGGNANIVVIKNLYTHEKIKFQIKLYKDAILSERLSTFMYSDSILWIGIRVLKGNETKNIAFTVNIQSKEIKSTITTEFVETIIPIGQKYFYLESNGKVFDWENLVKLDNPTEPVHMLLDDADGLCPIDWTSSSIGNLANCNFIKTKSDSDFVELLDGNFKLIFQLNVKDLFPNYTSLLSPDSNLDDSETIISVNDNLLLFLDMKNYIQYYSSNIVPGIANCYCWDFTSNSQVEFPSIKLNHYIESVVPFRSYNNGSCKIKFLSREGVNATSWSKIYESG